MLKWITFDAVNYHDLSVGGGLSYQVSWDETRENWKLRFYTLEEANKRREADREQLGPDFHMKDLVPATIEGVTFDYFKQAEVGAHAAVNKNLLLQAACNMLVQRFGNRNLPLLSFTPARPHQRNFGQIAPEGGELSNLKHRVLNHIKEHQKVLNLEAARAQKGPESGG